MLWFKYYFPLFLGMVIYDNEFETKENKIWTKDKIEPQQVNFSVFCITSLGDCTYLQHQQ